MAERLKQAYADKGLELPKAKPKEKHKEHKPLKSGQTRAAIAILKKSPVSIQPQKGSTREGSEAGETQVRSPDSKRKDSHNNSLPIFDLSCYLSTEQSKPVPNPVSSINLQIHNNAKLLLEYQNQDEPPLLNGSILSGIKTRCANLGDVVDERQMVLGLDFGTSSVKAVVGDPALGKAFAVPFQAGVGIMRYLLPTRLYESSGTFNLNAGEVIHRDLKLSLIANPIDPIIRERVIAFLALVIRHVRGWLFTEQREIYEHTCLFWKLAIGLPVAYHFDDTLHRLFSNVAHTAWLTSLMPSVDLEAIRSAEQRQRILKDSPEKASLDEDLEVSVVPEIAAQIYGFVNSSRFNERDQNIYLMVDVGAGSVDSSLFYVKRAKGKWDFEFFTSVVEPHGVMNLHRHRVGWWEDQLSTSPNCQGLAMALRAWKFPTDFIAPLPENFSEYFDGVSVKIHDDNVNPDSCFRKKILRQVRGQSYWRAWKDGLLTQAQLSGVPAFYCGGGMRMQYYNRLQDDMKSMPNTSWLRAIPRPLELPRTLEAPGLKRTDFDRMTVAFGLSFLEIGRVIKSLPPPKLPAQPESSWRSNYVDKDGC